MTTDTALRPSHRHVTAPSGHRLRITRWSPDARIRSVYRVMPDGALVELGTVASLGYPVCIAYPACPGPTIGCTSYLEGAHLLDAALHVETVQVYTVQVNTERKGT